MSKNNLQLRIALTGGYINSFGGQEGLTIENGNIINAVLMKNRDGLVLIENNGVVHAINLKDGSFILPNTNKKKIDPLHSIIDYAELIKWSKLNKATFFQTHLFAFKNKILINKKTANKLLRERRLLVLVKHQKSDKTFDIIINIREGVSIAYITEKVFDLLRTKKYKVKAILNLDVGGQDIMEVYNERGKKVLNAPLSISNSKNLLFYTRHLAKLKNAKISE